MLACVVEGQIKRLLWVVFGSGQCSENFWFISVSYLGGNDISS